MITKFPRLVRGKILIFSENTDDRFLSILLDKFGYQLERAWYYGSYIVNVPYGKELEAGRKILNKYPEFIENFERIDINTHTAYNNCKDVISCIEDLRDSLGCLDENGKNKIPMSWNDEIDDIIERLNSMKIS